MNGSSQMPNKRFLPTARVFSGVSANHSFLITVDGSVYAIGSNDYGQLALGHNKCAAYPVQVHFLDHLRCTLNQVACGAFHTLFLASDGRVWSCGGGQNGQLGTGVCIDRNLPEKIQQLLGVEAVEVSCGEQSSYVLTSEGIVLSCGWGALGQLGRDSGDDDISLMAISLPAGVKIVHISAGNHHAAAVDEDGTIWTWGYKSMGQLGRRDMTGTPGAIEGVPAVDKNTFVQVICGSYCTIVLYAPNHIYSIGFNQFGRLGIGHGGNQFKPVRIAWYDDYCTQKMSVGGVHAISLFESGEMAVYGWNDRFQLCKSDQNSSNTPKMSPYVSIEGSLVVDTVCGSMHTFLLTEDRQCYGVGHGKAFGREETIYHPTKLLDDVALGPADLNFVPYLYYVREEQEQVEGDGRTADTCIWVGNTDETHPIWLNEALLAVRCPKLLDGRDIYVEEYSEEVRDTIFRLLYTESTSRSRIATDLRELIGIQAISMAGCMNALYEQKESTGDVTISSLGGLHFKAHKFVLVARTSYFRSLYRGGWRETQANTVQLEMPLNDSFDDYLKYLYTGEHETGNPEEDDRFNEYLDYFGEG